MPDIPPNATALNPGQPHRRPLPARLNGVRAVLGIALAILLGVAGYSQPVDAAQLLQVRSASVLQVGDGNRHYAVKLACLVVPTADETEAADWLRRAAPRGTRLNLRPRQASGDALVAEVSRVDTGQDLGQGLIAAGLAQADSSC